MAIETSPEAIGGSGRVLFCLSLLVWLFDGKTRSGASERLLRAFLVAIPAGMIRLAESGKGVR